MKRPIDHFRNFWCADFFFYFWTLTVQLHKMSLCSFSICINLDLGSNTVQWNCTFIYIWQKRVTRLSLVNVKSNG